MAEIINGIPFLTVGEMRKVDDLMIRKFTIKLEMMMENAGKALSLLAIEKFLSGDARGKKVMVLCGMGGNGGGAAVCARHLFNRGANVELAIPKPQHTYTGVPAHQLTIIKHLRIPVYQKYEELEFYECDLIIDGLIGYALKGEPKDNVAELIHWANTHGAPILSLDIPSGLNPDTGEAHEPCIKAKATMSLAVPKIGLSLGNGPERAGELYLGDISVPPKLFMDIDYKIHVDELFGNELYIKL